MNVSFFGELLTAISDRGRQLLDLSGIVSSHGETIESLSSALLSGRGEASGVALARQILARYEALDDDGRRQYFRFLAESFTPDAERVASAARAYVQSPGPDALRRLTQVVEPPRLEFLRRLNLAPGATSSIVNMRTDLLRFIKGDDALAAVDRDFVHLLVSWFNRGFLVLQRIDWSTPANILEKIIRYEAVHEIKGWDDLRRRLDPADRRCFAFFHPSLVDEPLIFVQVALTRDVPGSIQQVLEEEKHDAAQIREPNTAVFYSISNCQDGLRGISFGNFLIKQVVEDLTRAIPSLKTFVTLSPVPGFSDWLERAKASQILTYLDATELAILDNLGDPAWTEDEELVAAMEPVLMASAAHYFLAAKNIHGRPVDPVARFHLGNGARLERINWLGNISPKGMREAHGLMVNYRYDLRDIERNHEMYAHAGTVAASKPVRSYLRLPEKSQALVPVGE
ncbi:MULTISPECIES: malonyl-CoA decarboxylase [Rhodomicrobium]|uniref:malonyl-CoA decarboxylase n=1 Tax=Rhodomicrobium TaxID=1068 RepID=UPI000B4A8CF4|nr:MULTISPECIES: malonyl-CoA decarboxylase [Rhodomicrobium]